MRTVFRIFAILAAALAVAGVLLALASGSSAAGPQGARPDRAALNQGEVAGVAGGAPDNASFRRPEHGGSEGPSLGGIAEVLKNLVIVALITALVSGGKRLLTRKRQGHGPARRQSAPPTAASSL